MPRTEKVQVGALTTWIEYEPATQERNGSWKSSASGRVRFRHEDGTAFVAETNTKEAYGRTAEMAVTGALTRAGKMVQRTVEGIQAAMEPPHENP